MSVETVTPGAGNRVGPASYVTLDYRLAAVVDGAEREVFTTFGARPVTLQIGVHQLPPALEARLLGLEEGAAGRFEIPAGDGFGHRHPDLVQSLAATVVDAEAGGAELGPGDVVEINAADGRRVAGVIKHRDARRVLLDFNHPLAGLPLRFEVRVIGVL